MGLKLILFKINIFFPSPSQNLSLMRNESGKKIEIYDVVIIVYLIFKKQCYVSGMIMINLY